MKKFTYCFLSLVSFSTNGFAQPIPPKAIEDSVLGWMKIYNYRGAKEPLKVDAKTYSVAQLSICDSFVNWMQASYVPKGGLGDVKRTVSRKLGLYDQNDAALPQSYGAYADTYYELKRMGNKLVPQTASSERWSIMANAPVGIALDAICTPTRYYFILPSFAEQSYGDDLPKIYGLATHENTKRYFTYFKRNSKIGNEKTVLLHPDNKFPFIKITRGEYLEQLADAIERRYAKEKADAVEKWFTQKTRDAARKDADDRYQKRMTALKNNQEKYKNRLQETAEIFTAQPDIFLENYPDVFEGQGNSALKLPVYKIDPGMAELCKKDKPQWIQITWHGDVTSAVGKHQHESILNNFNFEYVRNFFFAPEKVKGQPYKPLRSPTYEEAVVFSEESEQSKKMKADKSVFFFEDFSTTAESKEPNGWSSNLNFFGKRCVVRTLDGEAGNWAELKGISALRPTRLKGPLPQNFTITYDVVVPQNFTWGGKALDLVLSTETTPGNAESFLKVRARPGFGGRDGEVEIEPKFPPTPSYQNTSKYYPAPGFSNNKKNNRITMMIRKTGEDFQVFIDQNRIAEYKKAIPPGLLFNALSFSHGRSDSDTEKYYISNIKITKD